MSSFQWPPKASSGGGSGTVTSVGTGTGLTGGPITTTGTISLANTAVTPGSYTNTNLTVNAQGQITAAASGSGGGANVTLSNLTSPTAVNQDLIFDTGAAATVKTKDSTTTQTLHISSGASTSGLSGSVAISSGATSGGGDSGNINLTIGGSSGTPGRIIFQDGSQGTAGNVWASTDASGRGQWQNPTGLITGNANSVAYFDGSGLLANDPNVEWSTSNTPAFPPFPMRGFFAKTDVITGSPPIFGFGALDTAIDSPGVDLIFVGGSNTSVGATQVTGDIGFFTGSMTDAGATANTGAFSFATGNNAGTGLSGGINFSSGSTVNGNTGSVQFGTGQPSGSGQSGNVFLNTGSGSGNTGQLNIGSGPSAGGGITGDMNFTTGNTSTTGSSASGAISFRSGASLDGQSGPVFMITGDANGNGNTGQVELASGNSSLAASPGLTGNLQLSTGNISGAAATGNTGTISLATGNITDTGSTGVTGDVTHATGNNSGVGASGEFVLGTGSTVAGTTGSVNIQSGSSTGGSSGDVKINAGQTDGFHFAGEVGIGTAPSMVVGASADTGQIQIETGPITDSTATGMTGSINIESGDNSGLNPTGNVLIKTGNATTSTSGNITLQMGSAGTTRGHIAFLDGTEGTAGWVWTSIDTSGNGAWMAGGGGGGGANQSLSNLTSPTAINHDLLPGTTETINIGSAAETFSAIRAVEFDVYFGGTEIGLLSTDTTNLSLTSNAGIRILSTTDTTIKTTDVAGSGNTGNISILPGTNTGSGNGGNIDIEAGAVGVGGSGTPGTMTLRGGSSAVVSIGSQSATLAGGSGSNGASGGLATINGGSSDTGNTGTIQLITFASLATRGKIQFQEGSEGTAGDTWTSIDGSGSGTWSNAVNASAAQTTLTGSAGTAVCSQPFAGPSYKKVIVYLNGYTDTGTQTFTYPTAFTQTPFVYGQAGGVSGATASTTSVTFTTTLQTGFVFIEGY